MLYERRGSGDEGATAIVQGRSLAPPRNRIEEVRRDRAHRPGPARPVRAPGERVRLRPGTEPRGRRRDRRATSRTDGEWCVGPDVEHEVLTRDEYPVQARRLHPDRDRDTGAPTRTAVTGTKAHEVVCTRSGRARVRPRRRLGRRRRGAPRLPRARHHPLRATLRRRRAYQVQAWAHIESNDRRAHALVLAYARNHPVRRDDIFIGLRLVALHVDAGQDAADAHWSIRMEAHGARSYVGPEHDSYDSNPVPGAGERLVFRADGSGVLEWLDSTDPGDEDDRRGYPHNWSPEMETTAAELGLSDSAREVALDLVPTQLEPAEAIRLPGPTLWIPRSDLARAPAEAKTLGLLQAINPFEEGGIWQWFRRGTKYAGCIEERKAAKETFATFTDRDDARPEGPANGS